MKSIIYSYRFLYNIAVRCLYRKEFEDRYEKIALLIPESSTVVELCCGDCYLYKHYLKKKNVKYTGLDINTGFIYSAQRDGINVIYHNLLTNNPIPEAEYIIIQASMYHFLPDVNGFYSRLLKSTQKELIISEAVETLSTSSNPLIRFIARCALNPGSGPPTEYFTKQTFKKFCDEHSDNLKCLFEIANGKEMCAVFRK